MANLKPFYLLLGGIALVGGGAILFATRGGSDSQPRVVAPLSAGGADPGGLPGHVMGSESAPLEVEEYADFECPSCRDFAVLTLVDVVERYVNTGRIRWRFRHFPLYSIHQRAPIAHEAAACAAEQSRFWELHDRLYYARNDWVAARNPERTIRGYVETLGLDLGKYDECMAADRYPPRLRASAEAGIARGVNSTPTFVIGSVMFSGSLPFDRFRAILDSVLAISDQK